MNQLTMGVQSAPQVLRPYQELAIERIAAANEMGRRRVVLVIPTGGGKTTVASHRIHQAVAQRWPVLFVAHRKELIKQCSARLDEHDVNHGIIMAGTDRRNPRQLVQVGSIQTLMRRQLPPAKLIIVDECHRVLGASFQKLLDAYPEAMVIGLTATPWRLDGRGLGNVFEDLVEVTSVAELVEAGNLISPTIYSTAAPDLTRVKSTAGDYNLKALWQEMDKPQLVGDVVDHWLKLARGRKTVMFAVNVEHSVHLVDRFRAAGVRAAHIDANTQPTDRDAALVALKRGEIDVLSNVEILTEGWDMPAADCCILARPTQSLSLYLQMIGRIMRPAPGKADAIVLDHAGCVHAHGRPEDEREWTLWGPKDNRAPVKALTNCPECYAIITSGAHVCRFCGYRVRTVVDAGGGQGDAEVKAADGQLVEFTAKERRAQLSAQKRERYRELILQAERLGRSKRWADRVYREEFGVWPNHLGDVIREVFHA